MKENPAEFNPRKYLKQSVQAMYSICKDRYEAFETAGNASKIKPISLDEMSKIYNT